MLKICGFDSPKDDKTLTCKKLLQNLVANQNKLHKYKDFINTTFSESGKQSPKFKEITSNNLRSVLYYINGVLDVAFMCKIKSHHHIANTIENKNKYGIFHNMFDKLINDQYKVVI